MTPPLVVILRRPLTPMQRMVLDQLDEAPSYETIAKRLLIGESTVRMHVLAIAALLPHDFAPDGQPKERATLYAVRVWALGEIAKARAEAA